jgi:hypothetical protein
VKERRWDVDERGRGVADAGALAPGVRELVDALAIEGWVAEQPEAHLLPHIERACREAGLELIEHDVENAVLVVRIDWPGRPRHDEARAAAFSRSSEPSPRARRRCGSGGFPSRS